jgi:putative Mg2+ transporter-C (MgtC) family protein
MEWWRPELAFPILGALVAGGLIGFEREYRGRPAGFRTHMLVALTSALLMVAAMHQVEWMRGAPQEMIRIDPARMAHGILTGIGFLCGGVIFREGFSIHGLTTAASLWITSALGTLFGVGSHSLAIGGTVVTLAVLALLRLLDERMPQIHHIDLAVRYERGRAASEHEFLDSLRALGLKTRIVSHRLLATGQIELAGTFHSHGRARTAEISAALCADPRVQGFDLAPRHE